VCIVQSAPECKLWCLLTRHGSVRVLTRLTQSGVKHVERHLVALLRAGDGDQALIVVVLRLVDLDDAAAQLAYFVNLSTTLADDGSHHVVRDEDLLGDRLAREGSTALHRLLWSGRVRLSWTCVAVRLGLLRTSTNVWCARRAGTVAHRGLGVLSRRLALLVGHGVLRSRGARRRVCWPAAVLFGVAHLAASMLGSVRDDLHTTGNDALRTSVTDSISRSGRASEAFGQLLDESAANIISGNVNSVSNTEDHKRTLCGQGQARL
jgi:hypothetical protein